MNFNGNLLARLCVGASAFVVIAIWPRPVEAAQTHRLRPGETLAAVARQFKVSVKDIAAVNRLGNLDAVRDGTTLAIPDPPRRVADRAYEWKTARVAGDRVSVRLGPDSSYRRVAMLDKGDKVVVTSERNGWAQATLPGGGSGWLMQRFVLGADVKTGAGVVASAWKPKASAPKAFALLARKRSKIVVASTSSAPLTTRTKTSKPRHAHVKAVQAPVHLAANVRHETEKRALRLRRKQEHDKAAHDAAMAVARSEARRSRTHHRMVVAKNQAAPRRNWKRASPANQSSQSSEVASNSGSDIVRSAYAYRGTPYRYGGAGRGGFDCSGFTSYLYRSRGVSLPHTARGQFGMGRGVSRGEMKPGDLVFFHTVTSGISHVGMYVGNGHFVHASSRRSGGVREDSLDSGYYRQAFRGARRFRK